MKRAIFWGIAVLVFCVVLLGGASYWFGAESERIYADLLQQTSQASFIKLTNKSYERGFLKSKALTSVEIPLSDNQAEADASPSSDRAIRFTLAHKIIHGPISFERLNHGQRQLALVQAIIETTIDTTTITESLFHELLEKVPEIAAANSTVLVYLDGNGEARLDIPAFRGSLENDLQEAVQWKGLTADMTFSAGFKDVKGSLTSPGLEVTGESGVAFRLTEVASSFETHEGPSGLVMGEASCTVTGLEINPAGDDTKDAFSMKGLKVRSTGEAAGDEIHYAITAAYDGMTVGNTQYTPGIFDLELRRLDAASLAKLQQGMNELRMKAPHCSPEEITQLMVAKYMEVLPDLLKKSPEIELRQLSIQTTAGSFFGKAKVVFDGSKALPLVNPWLILSTVTAEAEAAITENLLQAILMNYKKEMLARERSGKSDAAANEEELHTLALAQSREQLDALVERNLIIRENGNYTTTVAYEQGQILVNGTPIPLQALLR